MPASALQTLGIGDDLGARYAAATAQSADAGQQIKKAQAEESAALAPVESKIKAENANSPVAPKLDNIPDKFQFQDKPPEVKKEDMSTLMMFAVIGGAMTRAPMTAALNAYAAGANAYHQGQQDEYKKQMEEFDRNLNIAKDKNSQAMEEYRAAVEKHKGDLSGLMTEWNLIAKKYDDTVASAQIQAQSADGMMKHIESLAKADQNLKMTLARMDQTDRRIADAEAKTDRQGWQVFQKADGTLVRVNPGTGQQEPFEGDTAGLVKTKAGGGAGSGGAGGNTRNQLVKAGATNALARMDELTATYGDAPKTSVMFGQHGDGVLSRTTHALGQKALSSDQQDIDARYASLVDEAIPVFTGGLRGSDAFRKFLMGQLPGPGDDDSTAASKLNLFRQNINGTLNTFAGKAAVLGDSNGGDAGGGGGVEYNGYHFPSQEALDKYKAAGADNA